MAGPLKPNDPNRRGDSNGSDDKKRTPLGFFSIVLWAIMLVFLLNTCRSTVESASVQTVNYSDFYNWVEEGYVAEVKLDANVYTFVLKEDAPPLKELVDQMEDAYGSGALQGLFSQFDRKDLESAASSTIKFRVGPVNQENFVQWLDEHDVEFHRDPVTEEQYMVSAIVSYVLPIVLMVGGLLVLYRYMFKKMGSGGGFGGIGGVGKANAKVYVEKKTGVTFKDVAGQDEAKESLEEIIDFLHNPGKYTEIGAKLPKGALLVGPPGTGKTLLAKAVAGEANVPFFSISGSDFVEMFVGVGASRVRDLFKEASKMAPCIIFIDEIDTIGKSRDNRMGGNDEREQTLNQLLAELDGFDPGKGVIVLGATNRPEVLDKALLRPGRFDRRITIDRPNLAGRLATLQVHTRKIKLAEDVDLNKIALATAGCVGADLANLVNEAALRAVRKGRRLVTQEDLLASFEFVIAGSEKKNSVLTEYEKKLVAYHEVGHAMVAYKQKNAEPVQKITIVPHTEGSLGYTLLMPEEDKTNLRTREELMAKITVSMGGRAAEEVVMETMTNGASQDIQEATNIARNM
ncbi:MAG: ATP-dependent zinc metalloprotease FtsH, partial [Oscillospiraceae bacterium]|nr:ATP-dependent zinc metalloprotease FtsH [Oscillospiraceae bacterium]